jgi:hypothetical protein
MRKLTILLLAVFMAVFTSCEEREKNAPVSSSGIRKATVEIKPGADGLTVEQRNVAERLQRDNSLGSLKHLYVISAYSGDVLIYSTVKGKVTSSGKRLTSSVTFKNGDGGEFKMDYLVPNIQDDGTYGSSVEYIYWFDSRDAYHQQYITGGQILHVSDQPIAVGRVILNMEVLGADEGKAE